MSLPSVRELFLSIQVPIVGIIMPNDVLKLTVDSLGPSISHQCCSSLQ